MIFVQTASSLCREPQITPSLSGDFHGNRGRGMGVVYVSPSAGWPQALSLPELVLLQIPHCVGHIGRICSLQSIHIHPKLNPLTQDHACVANFITHGLGRKRRFTSQQVTYLKLNMWHPIAIFVSYNSSCQICDLALFRPFSPSLSVCLFPSSWVGEREQ